MDQLPAELLSQIASQLDAPSLHAFRLASRHLNAASLPAFASTNFGVITTDLSAQSLGRLHTIANTQLAPYVRKFRLQARSPRPLPKHGAQGPGARDDEAGRVLIPWRQGLVEDLLATKLVHCVDFEATIEHGSFRRLGLEPRPRPEREPGQNPTAQECLRILLGAITTGAPPVRRLAINIIDVAGYDDYDRLGADVISQHGFRAAWAAHLRELSVEGYFRGFGDSIAAVLARLVTLARRLEVLSLELTDEGLLQRVLERVVSYLNEEEEEEEQQQQQQQQQEERGVGDTASLSKARTVRTLTLTTDLVDERTLGSLLAWWKDSLVSLTLDDVSPRPELAAGGCAALMGSIRGAGLRRLRRITLDTLRQRLGRRASLSEVLFCPLMRRQQRQQRGTAAEGTLPRDDEHSHRMDGRVDVFRTGEAWNGEEDGFLFKTGMSRTGPAASSITGFRAVTSSVIFCARDHEDMDAALRVIGESYYVADESRFHGPDADEAMRSALHPGESRDRTRVVYSL
jgi:hypothetical protein